MVPNELQEQSPKLAFRIYRFPNPSSDFFPVRCFHSLSLWECEPAWGIVVEPWYDVNMHVEDILRGRSSVGLPDVYPIGPSCPSDASHHLGHCDEQPADLIGGHLVHRVIVLLGNNKSVARVQGMNVQKGKRMGVFVDGHGVVTPLCDLAEDTFFQTGLQETERCWASKAFSRTHCRNPTIAF